MPDSIELLHPDKPVGWKGLAPCVVLADVAGDARPASVMLEIERHDTYLVARAVVTNESDRPVRLRSIRWVADTTVRNANNALAFPRELNPFYFATENLRGDYISTCTITGENYFKPLPTETVTLGWSEDLIFPGLFIGAETEALGLLCAAASAERFHLKFRLRGGNGRTWGFEIEEIPQGLEWVEIAPGGALAGERIFFGLAGTNDPQHATGDYYDVLRAAGAFARNEVNPLPAQRIWCSWNYDFLGTITERDVLAQLPVIVERFPMVKFVQVDHGYERVYPDGVRAMLDFLYETDAPYEAAKFPNGPRHLCDAVKAAGLRPATWFGFWVAESSDLVKDHSDWLLLDDMGRRLCFKPGRGVDNAGEPTYYPLDVSVAEVRDYIDSVCATVFGEWGFEGVKLDFFTFAFQCRRARYRAGGRTAMEYWKWLVETFRRHLPADGFLGLCSVAGTGSSVLGWGADYHRIGIDIGTGEWSLARQIAAWDLNTNMLLQERPVLPNIDSIGWSGGFDETQWRTWLNLCAVSSSTVEVSGDLTKLDERRCAILNRTLELSDPARRVWCPDVRKARMSHPPAIWLAEGPRDRLVGVFNWTDGPATIHFEALTAAWPDWYDAMEPAWDDQPVHLHPDKIDLEAHESILLRSPRR